MRSAFSLIELVMVLMILGIITAIASPRFSGASDGYKLEAAQGQIQSSIDLWADRAQRMSRFHTIHFEKDAEVIYLYDGVVTKPSDAVDLVDLGSAPFGMDLYRTSLGTPGELVINGDGFFVQSAAIQIIKGDLAATVTFASGSRDSEPAAVESPIDTKDLPDVDAVADALKGVGG